MVVDQLSGLGIQGVEIHFFRDETRMATAITDINGSYLSPPLPEGTYVLASHDNSLYIHELWDELPCCDAPDIREGNTVVVTAETEVAAVDFALELGAKISGTVTSARSNQAVKNTAVQICGSDGTFFTSARTNEEGLYTTPALRDGLYFVSAGALQSRVMAKAPACDLETSTPVQLVAGDHQLEVNLTVD